ncbi:MAG: NAD(P)H-hydrate epimerase [Erythrobacter sp.]|uniref:NAD(P)H-hydrate epimerase n=1 Tax=Erythrobacter sp. TaxID=1042 RepID=UPI00262CECE5|nr:NAD(P)H-hydrate epimerase [Erythrobacter sp.]MDJ0977864.1 NAD(P)H-hydrate epimerase [Erythrobacter sp.]
MSAAQVLTAEQMRAAERRIFDAGTTVGELMEIAAGGAAEWVRRLASGRGVTVLCGPGNNGGDGYVIARRLCEAGLKVQVVAPLAPKTQAAKDAKEAWGGTALTSGGRTDGGVFVDCLFGSGLVRPLSAEHALLLRDLAERHETCIAVDVPSGIATDTGEPLNEKLPRFDATLALGSWKFANCLTPARPYLGTQRLVPIGVEPVEGAAQRVEKPRLNAPATDAHKYRRGLCVVVSGDMPGASLLAAKAAMRSGAGYVKRTGPCVEGTPPGLVCEASPLAEALSDSRIAAVLVGPGLGRDEAARGALSLALESGHSLVLDADALHCLEPGDMREDRLIIGTPHDGELDALCRRFSVIAQGRMAKAKALAAASGMIVLAKGPDSFVALPDGALAIGPAATSWLSVAGSGDVLAGILVSRLATGSAPYKAAYEALWLHAKAARLCGPAFTADDLAARVSDAVAVCL